MTSSRVKSLDRHAITVHDGGSNPVNGKNRFYEAPSIKPDQQRLQHPIIILR